MYDAMVSDPEMGVRYAIAEYKRMMEASDDDT